MSTERQKERDAIVAYLEAKAEHLKWGDDEFFSPAVAALKVAAKHIRNGDHLVDESLDGGTAG